MARIQTRIRIYQLETLIFPNYLKPKIRTPWRISKK